MRSAVLLLALALTPIARSEGFVENPRFCSSNGEYCVVVRQYSRIADFDRVPDEEYWRTDPIEEWLSAYPTEERPTPPPPEPPRAAMFRILPSGNPVLLYEFIHESRHLFVTDDGNVVTAERVQCGKTAKLVTIRALDGSIVRTLNVRDVFTRPDQHWLCLREGTVRWSLESTTLQAQVLVTETWDKPESRFETVEIDLDLDREHPAPQRDLCPEGVRVEVEPDAVLPPAIHRETPEYPEVAIKVRIEGIVRAQLVIGRDGTVTSVTITKPLPFGLDEAVRTALRQWTFEPQPEPFTGEIAFRFEILRPPYVVATVSCFRSPAPMSTRE